jgi:hypothetical protein
MHIQRSRKRTGDEGSKAAATTTTISTTTSTVLATALDGRLH